MQRQVVRKTRRTGNQQSQASEKGGLEPPRFARYDTDAAHALRLDTNEKKHEQLLQTGAVHAAGRLELRAQLGHEWCAST